MGKRIDHTPFWCYSNSEKQFVYKTVGSKGDIVFDKPKSVDLFSIGGYSFANGFDLVFTTVGGYQGRMQFREPGSDELLSQRFDRFTALLSFFLCVAAIANPLLWPKVLALLLLYRGKDLLLEQSVKGWHWVEHQASFWLESLGRDDFDSINPISTRCGSSVVSCKSLFFTSVVMVGWDYGLWALPLVISSATASYASSRGRSAVLMMHPFPKRIIMVIAWPTVIFGYAVQRILFLRRPTQRQSELAQQWAREAAPVIASYIDGEPREVVILAILRQFPRLRL